MIIGTPLQVFVTLTANGFKYTGKFSQRYLYVVDGFAPLITIDQCLELLAGEGVSSALKRMHELGGIKRKALSSERRVENVKNVGLIS